MILNKINIVIGRLTWGKKKKREPKRFKRNGGHRRQEGGGAHNFHIKARI